MKVLIAVVLTLGYVSALGSGPYLPSGWRPDGPAFYLPSEPRKPVVTNPLQDVIFQGSEPSGSDFLREYGPPTLQSLPNVVTEQAFVILDAKFADEGVSVEAATEGLSDLRSELVEEIPTTTAQPTESTEEVTTFAEELAVKGRSLNLEVESVATESEVNTQDVVLAAMVVQQEVVSQQEASQQGVEAEQEVLAQPGVVVQPEVLIQQEVATHQAVTDEQEVAVQVADATLAAAEEVSARIPTEVSDEVKSVEDENNIAEAIGNLGNEVVTQQVQVPQDIDVFKSVEQSSGAVVPEGFLEYGPPGFQEYGPPGFKEYGPPKEDAFLRNNEAPEDDKIENNETRKRRFSPKFRSTKKN